MDLFGDGLADDVADAVAVVVVVVVVCECFDFVMVIGVGCWVVACTGWYLWAYRLYLCL